ncbi:hypothetical protein CLG96_01065 [Sphingomonas oleivorans]|uniref:Secreted protein n=2 Tax=Sphingomonas oleivorans TaxID=1735121 RepID=A0A2T5G308_9SPHN|nr:hypothetical protein CLG96_01065 [Sphingomonas oleivorans]
MKIRSILFGAAMGLVLLAAPAPAQEPDVVSAQPPERVRTLLVYGDDPCPQSTAEEIVVCARQPERERYRVPERFRDRPRGPAAVRESWANTVRELEYVGRAGTPNSCSVVGSGGQTGCLARFLTQARAEREAARREAADIP